MHVHFVVICWNSNHFLWNVLLVTVLTKNVTEWTNYSANVIAMNLLEFLSLSLSQEEIHLNLFLQAISRYAFIGGWKAKTLQGEERQWSTAACRIFTERTKKKQSRFSKWKKKLIAQLTDREKRHHKCNILPKLIFAIMLYRNAAPFTPVLLL